MARYFLELAYKGTAYSGFQVQENANTVQAELEKAIFTLQRQPVRLTGSSRTDTGVHALQNYFHFDFAEPIHPQFVYKMNALLPRDIALKRIIPVHEDAHSRFDAISREYEYRIYKSKNPFLRETAFYFPYTLDLERMKEGARLVCGQHDFFAFSKSNTQVQNYVCSVQVSEWQQHGELLVYHIIANRFLRGMVRMLTASLLRLGRHKMTIDEFRNFFGPQKSRSSYSVPSVGLFLMRVEFPPEFLSATGKDLRAEEA